MGFSETFLVWEKQQQVCGAWMFLAADKENMSMDGWLDRDRRQGRKMEK